MTDARPVFSIYERHIPIELARVAVFVNPIGGEILDNPRTAALMGVPEQQAEGIRLAGYLHDIGKIAVPAEILAKPGKLSQDEFGIIKTHPQFGYDILKEIEFAWPVALVTLQHHERLNGMGYPRKLTSAAIPTQSKLMAICDVHDALVAADRPYKAAVSIPRSLEILEDETRAGLLDPDALAIFLEARIYDLTKGMLNVEAVSP